jgi:hypothetical protein
VYGVLIVQVAILRQISDSHGRVWDFPIPDRDFVKGIHHHEKKDEDNMGNFTHHRNPLRHAICLLFSKWQT